MQEEITEPPDAPDDILPIEPDDILPIEPDDRTIVDLALIYGGGAHRNVVWNKSHLAPYVSYTDRKNKEQWLFDGFLFLEIVDGKGKIFATGYYGVPATKKEWLSLADYYFKSGQCVDALNEQITDKIKTLDEPERKRKIIVAIPEPIAGGPNSNYKETPADYWGVIDGKKLDFNNQNDRIIACKWYIDYVIECFNKGNYSNIVLDGFYWIAEETLHTQTILATVGEYLENDGYTFNWIPYWKTNPDYYNWSEYGFHRAYLQPNYFFNETIPYSRLEEACKVAFQYELDLEMEFDLRVFVNNGDRGSRLYDYMQAFRENDVLSKKRIAYYQDCDALYQLSSNSSEKEKELFHDFCDFVIEHQEKYKNEK